MDGAKVITRPGRQGWRATAGFIKIAACLSISSVSYAADWESGPLPATIEHLENMGVPCSIGAPIWAPLEATAAELPWRSVWLGHFSGGRPYSDGTGQTLIDWRDEKFCFPERRQCQDWVHELRHAYHRPEGYWTCLLLR
jgi:hypothetical protein